MAIIHSIRRKIAGQEYDVFEYVYATKMPFIFVILIFFYKLRHKISPWPERRTMASLEPTTGEYTTKQYQIDYEHRTDKIVI
ncbi:MAG: hypothetical protein U0586_12975 [Candidatus Brocadiaceae bacterium]